MSFELYPNITFVVILFNFTAWYFQGQPLFSWWHLVWILPVEQIMNAIVQDINMRIFNKWGK